MAKEAKVSKGKGIEVVNWCDIKHFCHTEPGSSGGPILSEKTNKVIGIHKGTIRNGLYNIGTFLKDPLDDLKLAQKVSKNNNYYLI